MGLGPAQAFPGWSERVRALATGQQGRAAAAVRLLRKFRILEDGGNLNALAFLAADGVGRDDNSRRNGGDEQTVFNAGSARLVAREPSQP